MEALPAKAIHKNLKVCFPNISVQVEALPAKAIHKNLKVCFPNISVQVEFYWWYQPSVC